ncbi:MAG: helix-turn-helix domain-containing protein [Planctomycetia bacterium]|nr:helix-turn-helix domain-containing protein [Planctomycetia bacterium]
MASISPGRSDGPACGPAAAAAEGSGAAPRIALAFPAGGVSHWQEVQRGVVDEAIRRGWRLAYDPDAAGTGLLARYLRWPCEGLIAALSTAAEMRMARDAGMPVVNISDVVSRHEVPLVTFDNEAIGRLAAGHLLRQGYVRFAFYGLDGVGYSQKRQRGFCEELQRHGHACEVLESPHWFGRAAVDDEGVSLASNHDLVLDRWLIRLADGTGLFAVSDTRALLVMAACRRLSIDVPRRLGVLGVGNFRDLCESSQPPLSSIRHDGHGVGVEACRMLAALMAGGPPAGDEPSRLVAPLDVAVRASTGKKRAESPIVPLAMTYIRDHIEDRFDIDDLVRTLKISRRKLERAFRQAFDESPHARLIRMRVEASAAAMASRPGLTLAEAVRAGGFRDARHLRRAWKHFGLPPFTLK